MLSVLMLSIPLFVSFFSQYFLVDFCSRNMHVVLMVAEKPSLAEALAKIMSHGDHTSRRGSNGACSIHEWNGTFRGSPVRFKMTSVCGHVMALDFVGRFNSWDAVDPVSFFSFLFAYFM